MNKTEIQQKRCERCHALIRFDRIDPESTRYSRPPQSQLFLGSTRTGMIYRSVFNHAFTWEFECIACLMATTHLFVTRIEQSRAWKPPTSDATRTEER